MVSSGFKEAAVEVLDILEHTKKSDVEKIPESFINFLKENSSKTYVSKLDHSKAIKDMELKPKTEAILGLIYMKYWADETGKQSFENKIQKSQELLSIGKIGFEMNVSDRNDNSKEKGQLNELPEEYKEKWFIKLFNKLKRFLGVRL